MSDPMGPEWATAQVSEKVRVCPLCKCRASGVHNLKNGAWAFEPVGNFGISNAVEGMVCAEWDSNRLWVYYHSPEDIELGELIEREGGGSDE